MVQIGPHILDNPLVLSPMAGVTDAPFREICLQHGAGLVVGEMLSSKAALRDTDKSTLRVKQLPSATPHIKVMQIAGTEPQELAAAARYNASLGADIIDINMGCPAKKVCNKLAGSALLSNEALVADILNTTVKAVDIPVTLKFRTGPSRDNRNALTIAKIAADAGIQSLALHGRSREDKYLPDTVCYDMIAAVKQSVNIPVFANGDIDSALKAKQVLNHTAADGLYIGRAAQGNPWLFRNTAHYLKHGTELAPPSLLDISATLMQHISLLHDFYGEPRGVRVARKHISWYFNTIAQTYDLSRACAEQRALLMASDSIAEQSQQLEKSLEHLLALGQRQAA